jgi:hypothetical protein
LQATRGAEKDVREIAGSAALARKRLRGGRRSVRRIGFANRLIVQPMQEGVQFGERITAVRRANIESKIPDRRVRLGQRRIAPEQARREPLDGAEHHPFGILRLDLTVYFYAQLGERAVDGEHMREIAKGVLMGVEPHVAGNVDAPTDHILAFVVARREPQHLDHAPGRRIVTMGDAVGDAQAHNGLRKPDKG